MRRPLFSGVILSAASTTIALRTLWPNLDSAIPGPLGDNVAFVWNTWWAAHAWQQFPALFRTSLLFAPWGANLTLHTHTILPSTIAALIPASGAILRTNLLVAAHLTLNAICAYALAWRVTRQI